MDKWTIQPLTTFRGYRWSRFVTTTYLVLLFCNAKYCFGQQFSTSNNFASSTSYSPSFETSFLKPQNDRLLMFVSSGNKNGPHSTRPITSVNHSGHPRSFRDFSSLFSPHHATKSNSETDNLKVDTIERSHFASVQRPSKDNERHFGSKHLSSLNGQLPKWTDTRYPMSEDKSSNSAPRETTPITRLNDKRQSNPQPKFGARITSSMAKFSSTKPLAPITNQPSSSSMFNVNMTKTGWKPSIVTPSSTNRSTTKQPPLRRNQSNVRITTTSTTTTTRKPSTKVEDDEFDVDYVDNNDDNYAGITHLNITQDDLWNAESQAMEQLLAAHIANSTTTVNAAPLVVLPAKPSLAVLQDKESMVSASSELSHSKSDLDAKIVGLDPTTYNTKELDYSFLFKNYQSPDLKIDPFSVFEQQQQNSQGNTASNSKLSNKDGTGSIEYFTDVHNTVVHETAPLIVPYSGAHNSNISSVSLLENMPNWSYSQTKQSPSSPSSIPALIQSTNQKGNSNSYSSNAAVNYDQSINTFPSIDSSIYAGSAASQSGVKNSGAVGGGGGGNKVNPTVTSNYNSFISTSSINNSDKQFNANDINTAGATSSSFDGYSSTTSGSSSSSHFPSLFSDKQQMNLSTQWNTANKQQQSVVNNNNLGTYDPTKAFDNLQALRAKDYAPPINENNPSQYLKYTNNQRNNNDVNNDASQPSSSPVNSLFNDYKLSEDFYHPKPIPNKYLSSSFVTDNNENKPNYSGNNNNQRNGIMSDHHQSPVVSSPPLSAANPTISSNGYGSRIPTSSPSPINYASNQIVSPITVTSIVGSSPQNKPIVRLIPKANVEMVSMPPPTDFNAPEIIHNGDYVVRVEKVPLKNLHDAYYNPEIPGEYSAASNTRMSANSDKNKSTKNGSKKASKSANSAAKKGKKNERKRNAKNKKKNNSKRKTNGSKKSLPKNSNQESTADEETDQNTSQETPEITENETTNKDSDKVDDMKPSSDSSDSTDSTNDNGEQETETEQEETTTAKPSTEDENSSAEKDTSSEDDSGSSDSENSDNGSSDNGSSDSGDTETSSEEPTDEGDSSSSSDNGSNNDDTSDSSDTTTERPQTTTTTTTKRPYPPPPYPPPFPPFFLPPPYPGMPYPPPLPPGYPPLPMPPFPPMMPYGPAMYRPNYMNGAKGNYPPPQGQYPYQSKPPQYDTADPNYSPKPVSYTYQNSLEPPSYGPKAYAPPYRQAAAPAPPISYYYPPPQPPMTHPNPNSNYGPSKYAPPPPQPPPTYAPPAGNYGNGGYQSMGLEPKIEFNGGLSKTIQIGSTNNYNKPNYQPKQSYHYPQQPNQQNQVPSNYNHYKYRRSDYHQQPPEVPQPNAKPAYEYAAKPKNGEEIRADIYLGDVMLNPQDSYDSKPPNGYPVEVYPQEMPPPQPQVPSKYPQPNQMYPNNYDRPAMGPIAPQQPYQAAHPMYSYQSHPTPENTLGKYFGKLKNGLKMILPKLRYSSGDPYPPQLDQYYRPYLMNASGIAYNTKAGVGAELPMWNHLNMGDQEVDDGRPPPQLYNCDQNRIGKCVVPQQSFPSSPEQNHFQTPPGLLLDSYSPSTGMPPHYPLAATESIERQQPMLSSSSIDSVPASHEKKKK